MAENVRRCVTDNDIQGIKLHLLHLMTNTRMQSRLPRRTFATDESGRVCSRSFVTSWKSFQDIGIHRITGDAPRYVDWSYVSLNKWEVSNAIKPDEAVVKVRMQGCKQEFKK